MARVTRRSFLSALAALPFCGWLKPTAPILVAAPYSDDSICVPMKFGAPLPPHPGWVQFPEHPYTVTIFSERLQWHERNFDPARLPQ